MQGELTAILLLSCAQQWPGKLLHFLTMIWFCDPLSIVPYQPLEGACWLSSNFQSWNLGGTLQDFESTQAPQICFSPSTPSPGVPSPLLGRCAVLVLPAVRVALWWSSEGTGTAAPRRAVPQGRGQAGAAHALLLHHLHRSPARLWDCS